MNLAVFHLTAFLSAFLLFQVQPMLSKWLLPTFGGSYLVWGSCMVFFQAALLLGYAYSHVVQAMVGAGRYARVHPFLMVLVLFSLPLSLLSVPQPLAWLPLPLQVLIILLLTVGIPFIALSTTSTVLQRWLSQRQCSGSQDPYVLFASSNLGSMIGLYSYPLLAEPYLSLQWQGIIWSGLFTLLVVCLFLCAPWQQRSTGIHVSAPPTSREPWTRRGPAFLSSMTACFLLLAVTNVLTFDLASVPLLWTIPMGIYLLSFVLVFKAQPWRPAWLRVITPWTFLIGALLYLFALFHLTLPPWALLLTQGVILFVGCMECHHRLAECRPPAERDLTFYYVVMALGGVTGSILVGWLIPVISHTQIEFSLALILLSLCKQPMQTAAPDSMARKARLHLYIWLGMGLCLLGIPALCRIDSIAHTELLKLAAMVTALPVMLILLKAERLGPAFFASGLLALTLVSQGTDRVATGLQPVARLRNYYGTYSVYDHGNLRYLQHGTTQHGRQYREPGNTAIPLSYYHPTTPAARILSNPPISIQDIAMIGLGTGGMAMYAATNQTMTIFELDPDNLAIANRWFSFLSQAGNQGARLSFHFGDGRLLLQKEPTASFDVLILDAFNSGSIPTHLLTREAIQEYLRVLRGPGLILIHISNKSLSLAPLIFSNARAEHLPVCEASNFDNLHPDAEPTQWAALSNDPALIQKLITDYGWNAAPGPDHPLPSPWTDQFSNILSLLLWK